MSERWNPEPRVRQRWPEGARTGLALVAVACLSVVATLYWVAGPRDVFAP